MTRVTSLEDYLAIDKNGQTKQHMLDRLMRIRQQLINHTRLPQAPDTYQEMCLKIEACKAAENTIQILWERYHAKLL
jgi:type III secretion system YseE family protein